jgi:polyhydroxyalkanoate synthesis regulator phasin
MSFSVSWHTLLDELGDLPDGSTLITPLSHNRFRIADVQEQRVVIEFPDRDIDETRPLQRDQFETLYRRITDEPGSFDLDRLPPDADPYPAVLSLHPRFEVDEDAKVITETEGPTSTQLLDSEPETETAERTEPDLDVYADALLLVDALERHEVEVLEEMDTDALVNLYTLLSDVQRNANDLRHDVTDMLLNRLHHDQPVSGPFGSVQRTTRRNRSLKDEEEVLETLEEAGIDSERVLGVDRDKVDDALDVTELSERDVYDIKDSECVRKAEVDEERKETRLQGLKDQLAVAEGDEAEELRGEIEELEGRIEELTEFKSGSQFHTRAGGEP